MPEFTQNLSSRFCQEYKVEPIRSQFISGDEMALSEHIEEFSQRLIFCLICLILATLFCFADRRVDAELFLIAGSHVYSWETAT